MPAVLTTAATVLCSHGGRVQLPPGRPAFTAGGGPVLAYGDLEGAPVVGCPQAGPGIKPCSAVAGTVAGASTVLTAGGAPVLLVTATGVTDGVPPGTWSVVAPGPARTEAR